MLLSSTGVFQRHYELVAEDILARCPGGQGRVLDIGTGPAWLLVALHRRCPELHLVGADISAAMVARAARNLAAAGCADAVQVVEAPAGRLPFPDGSFDAAVSTGSLHHWKDPVGGLDEIHRVLRSGGQALIYDLVRHTPREVMAEAARQFGRLRMTLLRLHSFEEPFLDPSDLRLRRLRGGGLGFGGFGVGPRQVVGTQDDGCRFRAISGPYSRNPGLKIARKPATARSQ